MGRCNCRQGVRVIDVGHSISVLGSPHRVTLAFKRNGVPQREEVRIERTPCRFGGERPWFRCPECERRVGVLYLRSCFMCRKCARLVYRSQRAGMSERGWMKVRKGYRALGLEPEEAEGMEYLPKPRGMHWQTFSRHLGRLKRGAAMRDAWMLTPPQWVLRMLARRVLQTNRRPRR